MNENMNSPGKRHGNGHSHSMPIGIALWERHLAIFIKRTEIAQDQNDPIILPKCHSEVKAWKC